MKRKIALILILALFLSSLTAFAELELNLNGHWAERVINKEFIKTHFSYLIKDDAISFNPDDKIDKRSFMYSLYSIINDSLQENSEKDAEKADAKLIKNLKDKKIVESDATLEGEISRKDMVKHIIKTLELLNEIQISDPEYLPYKDIQGLDDEYKKFILKANMIGIIKGFEDSTFRPEESTSIAEAIIMLQRLKEELGMLKNEIPFKAIESNTVYSDKKATVTMKTEKNKVIVTIAKEFPTSGYKFTVDKVKKKDKGRYEIHIIISSPAPDTETLQVITYQQTTIEIDKNLIDSKTFEFEVIDVNAPSKP